MQSHCHSLEQININLQDPRYEIIELLGSGAMACVYLARERQSNHLYAFKILHETFRHSQKHRDIFRTEAETMRNFQHPNIVRFYRYVEEDTYAYIQMDYIKGVTLLQILQKARQQKKHMPLAEVLHIITQAAQGLSYLHYENQLHLDIKPANILISEASNSIYLTDLGLTMDGGKVRTYVAGTPYYMPYEQQQGNTNVTTSADAYALAIVTYEMLALRRPFELEIRDESGRDRLKQAHKEAPVPSITGFRPDLPTQLDALFTKALAKNPDERYSVEEFVHHLRQSLENHTVAEAIPQQPKQPGQAAPAKSKRIIPAITILMIALAATAGILLLRQQDGASQQVASADNQPITLTQTAVAMQPTELRPSATPEPTDQQPVIAVNNTEPTATSTSTPPPPTPTPTQTVSNMQTAETHHTQIQPVASSTSTPTPQATKITIPKATATATATPTPTQTHTSTPQPPTFTPTAQPTAYLSDEPLFLLAENAEAIGVATDLNTSIGLFQQENQWRIPLRSGSVNGFYVLIQISNPQDVEEYGIVYRYQSETNYRLFRILSNQQQWQIIEITDNGENILQSGALDTLPYRLAVAGKDTYFRYETDNNFVQFKHTDIAEGSLSLWLKNAANTVHVDTIQIALLGDEAVTASISPPTLQAASITTTSFLKNDLDTLLATSTLEGTVNCADFITVHDSLERHLERPAVKEYAESVLGANSFIYNRCRTGGASAVIDLNDSYVDFLMWQTHIMKMIDILTIESL